MLDMQLTSPFAARDEGGTRISVLARVVYSLLH